MKKIFFNGLMLVLLIGAFWGCKKESATTYLPTTWRQAVLMKATPLSSNRDFISEVNLVTNARTWSNDSVTIKFDLDWPGLDVNPVKTADIFLYVQEKTTSGNKTLGLNDGKKIATVSSFAADGSFTLKLKVDEVYNFYKNDFTVTTRPNKLLPDDVFEIKWVLTGNDGQVLDTRSGCNGEGCQYGFKVSTIADIWSGTFGYEYIQVGAGIQCCIPASVPRVLVGTKGNVTFTKISNGVYSVPDAEFGASWNGAAVGESLTFDYNSGSQFLSDTKAHAVKWTFSNNKGNTIDLKWVNKWEVSFKEWGVVRLTRTDGVNWPTNLK